MSFSAELIIEGKPYKVRSFSWGVQQTADVIGRPDARIQGGQLQIELDSVADEALHHWALDDAKKMSGSIQVMASDNARSTRQEIRFEDAYCVGLGKQFDGSASNIGMTMRLSLSANKLICGQLEVDNKWPV